MGDVSSLFKGMSLSQTGQSRSLDRQDLLQEKSCALLLLHYYNINTDILLLLYD